MKRALKIGDDVTFREETYDATRRSIPWLAGMTWSQWSASAIPLRIQDTEGGGRVRRVFYLTIGERRAIVWPSAVKLDDRARRNKFRAAIEAERAAARELRTKRGKKSAPA